MTHKPKLFGTDGMRGIAGRYPLDRETLHKFAKALAGLLHRIDGGHPQVVLGEDTRESSNAISRVLATGLEASGVDLTYAGVITTPG